MSGGSYIRYFISKYFFATHICLMVFGPAVLWITLFTAQGGIVAFIALMSFAAKKDREDFKNPELKNQDVSNES